MARYAFYFSMAIVMIELVLKSGRAYRCVPCGYIENRSRAEIHIYKRHMLEHEILFACVSTDFKTGERR